MYNVHTFYGFDKSLALTCEKVQKFN